MASALLLHGIGSGPSTLWRLRGHLEARGWTTTSPSILGHDGRPVPTSLTLDAYAADIVSQPAPDEGWDLVVAHSLGASIATIIASRVPGWTRRLLLIDPAWDLAPELAAEVRAGELADLALTEADVVAASPHWDARDVRTKVAALALVPRATVERTFDENPGWDLLEDAAALAVPTLVLTGDPEVFTFVPPALADSIRARNARIEVRAVAGAGHAPHRDRPEAALGAIDDWLTAG